MIDLYEQLCRQAMCARCEARPGEDCTTATGARATRLHASRTEPVLQAYGAGYEDAMHDARTPGYPRP